MEQNIIKSTTGAVSNLLQLAKFTNARLWIDYDKEADVLYINFGEPQKADDAYQQAGIIQRKKKDKLIGLTILNVSTFA